MGVPALFRFLQRKYPKIIVPVVEEQGSGHTDGLNGPPVVDITTPNPNGQEFDNLYLDMNGIVHPCTHPEGKPAPASEEEMMVEIFNYTDRIVNMVRPRKLLFMAIDGVAPRAKMNQQRSRRFRSSQDAEKEAEALKEAIAEWEGMGHSVSDDIKNKKSWDSNAITPGTPFMALLAASLRYWVVHKLNNDPGWKGMEVIISDASVPGEGEHKIMDWIRRQRVNPGHDHNTSHVIYGLDADLIMLALATHEPHFRVLREDVFADSKKTGCHSCGRQGHQASECTSAMKYNLDGNKPKSTEGPKDKTFIFLDVTILREYLEIALNLPNLPFPFDLEVAIDDWIFLIFFVGNDFLPHLPSLDIRKGGIDTLLEIWKKELPRMGGYVTNHGHLRLERVQIILDGLARQEADIFRKNHEDDERQKQRDAARSVVRQPKPDLVQGPLTVTPVPALAPAIQSPSSSLPRIGLPPSLPAKPNFDMFAPTQSTNPPASAQPVVPLSPPKPVTVNSVGSNQDVVAQRSAIRMANMSAAEALKAEMHGLVPLGRNVERKPLVSAAAMHYSPPTAPVSSPPAPPVLAPATDPVTTVPPPVEPLQSDAMMLEQAAIEVIESAVTPSDAPTVAVADDASETHTGMKRKASEMESSDEDKMDADAEGDDDEDEQDDKPVVKRTKTEEHDDIKLWTPGYQERYYKSKFENDWNDLAFRKKVTTHYIEGLCWVLHYYYQGTPSWQWYYPFHYAPFAGDFDDADKMVIQFRIGQPFKPFEQLMAVFPPASRMHIPAVYHPLMLEEDSPIKDFYPLDFEVDLNGKTQAWQGIALLPFIDEKRLLDAMAVHNPKLAKDEVLRNTWGSSSLMISDGHPLFNSFITLYTKRKKAEAANIDPNLSGGISGKVIADPNQVPGTTYISPLSVVDLPDIPDDKSLSVLYFFPKQLTPHRSVLLSGARRPPRTLDSSDVHFVQSGRSYNPNQRNHHGRDNNFANVSALGRGNSGGYGRQGGGSYGGGGYQERSYDGHHGYNNGPSYGSGGGARGGYAGGYNPSYNGGGSRSPNYAPYGGPSSYGSRGGAPPYHSGQPSHSNYGQRDSYGGPPARRGRGGYY